MKQPGDVTRTHAHRRQRGSVYLAVLGASTIVFIVGAAAMLGVRLQNATTTLDAEVTAAQQHAVAAIDLGRWWMTFVPGWRADSGASVSNQIPFGSGAMALHLSDPIDNDLADSPTDRVRLTGLGVQGGATQIIQVDLDPAMTPVGALSSALHATGQIYIASGQSLTVIGAPVSTNANLRKEGAVIGDIQAASFSGGGAVVGRATIADAKSMPAAQVVDTWMKMASKVNTSEIREAVLAPGWNPWGATNADGVYYIKSSDDVRLRDCRIHGTLIIQVASGKEVRIEDNVFIHPARPDYPTLIITGDVEMDFTSESQVLSESSVGANLNPFGAPYEGQTDFSLDDSYPSEIQGLVYIRGNVVCEAPGRVRGVMLVDGVISLQSSLSIVYDKSFAQAAPAGFVDVAAMTVVPGSWKRLP